MPGIRRGKQDWSALARSRLIKEARAFNAADRAMPKTPVDKAKLREEADQAIREFRESRQSIQLRNLDDFLHKKY